MAGLRARYKSIEKELYYNGQRIDESHTVATYNLPEGAVVECFSNPAAMMVIICALEHAQRDNQRFGLDRIGGPLAETRVWSALPLPNTMLGIAGPRGDMVAGSTSMEHLTECPKCREPWPKAERACRACGQIRVTERQVSSLLIPP